EHDVCFLAARGEHEDGHDVPLANPPAHRESVEIGQHPVEDDEVRHGPLDRVEGSVAIHGLHDLMTVLTKLTRDQLIQVGFVFDDQYLRHPWPASSDRSP